MQVIRLNANTIQHYRTMPRVVMALGFFDGVHRGHQAVLAQARRLADARQVPLAVMTFSRHASRAFETTLTTDFRYLNTISQKVDLLGQNHADIVYVVDFDRQFAAISPQQFVETYLIGLNACGVVGGFDYTFGRGGHTQISQMAQYSRGRFTVTVVAEHDAAQEKIGSTAIRHLVKVGNVARANALLGHPYALAGQVIPQDRGTFAFNPASRLQQRPPQGSYRCQLKTTAGMWPGTLTITADGLTIQTAALSATERTVEVAILARQAARVVPWQRGSAPVIAVRAM